MRGIEALEALLLCEVLEERLRVLAAHIALGENLEGDAVVQAAEFLHLRVAARLLPGELVAGEAEDLESLVLVLQVELLQFLAYIISPVQRLLRGYLSRIRLANA